VLNDMTSVDYELKRMREIAVMACFKILSKNLTELFGLPTVSLFLVVIELTVRHCITSIGRGLVHSAILSFLLVVPGLRMRHSFIFAVHGLKVKHLFVW
jgi:hypothetical protein